jgi:hypothetical protein
MSLLVIALTLGSISPALAQKKPKEPLWTHAFDLGCRKYGENVFTNKTAVFGIEVFKDANTGYGLYVSQIGSFAAAPGFTTVDTALKDSKRPVFVSGLDLPSRKAGEKEFTDKTRVYGAEIFRDANVGNWMLITQTGAIAVTPAKEAPTPAGGPKAPKWTHSVDLSCRKGGITQWKDAHKFGIEVYRENNTGSLIYICDTGAIAALADSGVAVPTGEGKAPVWLHGLDLYCRKHDEPDFTKNTQKFGVEVFRDENNGNLIYLCETGALAVVSGRKGLPAPTPAVREPKWTHGLNLSCRVFGEREFTEKTRVYGAEVFRDENSGVTLYIAETGSIAAVHTK